jgi:hypothetical protein
LNFNQIYKGLTLKEILLFAIGKKMKVCGCTDINYSHGGALFVKLGSVKLSFFFCGLAGRPIFYSSAY